MYDRKDIAHVNIAISSTHNANKLQRGCWQNTLHLIYFFRIVHVPVRILLLFIHPHAVANLYSVIFSVRFKITRYIYIIFGALQTFTLMHLVDTFIESNWHYIHGFFCIPCPEPCRHSRHALLFELMWAKNNLLNLCAFIWQSVISNLLWCFKLYLFSSQINMVSKDLRCSAQVI